MLALTMICASNNKEAKLLEQCLESVHKHVDGIFVNINHKPAQKPSKRVIDVVKRYGGTYIVTEWENNFSKARKDSLAMVPDKYDWLLWLDTDDTVDKPHNIKKVIKNAGNFDGVLVNYQYAFDEFGNVNTQHRVIRLWRNNNSFEWSNSIIHEILVASRGVITGNTDSFQIVHHSDYTRNQESTRRDVEMLKQQLDNEGDKPDPRTVYYLGDALYEVGDIIQAKELLELYVASSGWDEELSQAYVKLGKIAIAEDHPREARVCFLKGMAENPYDAEPYVELGMLEQQLDNHAKAVHWLKIATKLKVKTNVQVNNPLTVNYRANLLLAQSCITLGGDYLEEGLKYAKKALKTRPKDEFLINYTANIQKVVDDKKRIVEIVNKIKTYKSRSRILKLLENVPEDLSDNPLIIQLKSKYAPFRWPDKSIAIYTGESAVTGWGPWSLKSGIGGSEEAVVRISRQLVNLGYKVVVFGTPIDKVGEHDGVQWRNHWECQLDDEFDIFISWRNPYVFDRDIKARKRYLWLHDVMEPGDFTPKRIANMDRVMVLSKYHRTCFPMIPDNKIFYTGNGIDPDEFSAMDGKIERDPHKLIYTSSHVRGLINLYDIWEDVKKAVPDATLDVYYGWDSYDKITAGNPERAAWKEMMVNRAKELDGVTDHGRAGQDEIVRASFRSGIWAYPTAFPEIYCITAVKCQAAGTVPVCSNYAALDEYVQYGQKMEMGGDNISLDSLYRYKAKLIWWMQHPEEQDKIRPEMMEWARTLSWQATAEGWAKDFESNL